MTIAQEEPPQIARRTALMAVGTLLSRITGFGRIFALAYALGATRLTDTYTLANNTPNILYELVLGGVLSGTLLAVFVRELSTSDEDDAWTAISAVVTMAMVAAAVLAAAFVLVAPLFIRLYTIRNSGDVASDQLSVATDLLRLFAPQVFFYGVVTVSTALLTAQRRFAAPMFAPVLNNAVVIGVLLAFPHVAGTRALDEVRGDTGALLLLGLGTTAGVLAMAGAQLPFKLLQRGGAGLRWLWAPRHPAVRTILRLSGWTVGFVAANQVALFAVQFLANGDPGDVAVYAMAQVVFLLPHGVVAVSIMTAIAPELAERWSLDDRAGFRRHVSFGLRAIAAVSVPAAVGYILLARPIVSALLEYGALQGRSAEAIAGTLALMAVGLPAFSCWLFLTRVYQALQDTRSLFFLYLIENGINIALAFAFYPTLGVEGLGLAYGIAYIGGTGVAIAHLRRRTGGVEGGAVVAAWFRVLCATAVMALVVAGSRVVVDGSVTEALVGVTAGVTVYLVAARTVGVAELTTLLRIRRAPP